jgi:hypothetical protein
MSFETQTAEASTNTGPRGLDPQSGADEFVISKAMAYRLAAAEQSGEMGPLENCRNRQADQKLHQKAAS